MRDRNRLGCLTPIGLLAALITILIMAGVGFTQGGAMFSPGLLSAFHGPALGGVESHAQLSTQCAACHTAPWDATPMTVRCVSCHSAIVTDVQNPKSLHGGLIHSAQDLNCLNCHTEHHGPQAMLTRLDLANFPHEVTGFSLKAHRQLSNGKLFDCSACHAQNFRRVSASICQNCHNREDKAFMADHGLAFGQACLNCHDGVDTFGKAFDHNQASFALLGKHAAGQSSAVENSTVMNALFKPSTNKVGRPDCTGCHHNQTTIAELKNTPTQCAACHQKDDAHQGILGTDCSGCHTPKDWKASTFDHAARTTFALVGQHQQARCQGCHATSDLKSTPADCAACHQKDDPHQSKLGADCQSCHTPASWKPSTFDHAASAFQLTGQHQKAACSGCHKDQLFTGTPTSCAACHGKDDPHQGKLGADCQSCHTTAGWKPSTFNHNNAAFKLVGRHQQAACSACHQDKTFKGASTTCVACHQKDDAHKGGLGTDCALCHTPSAWKPSTFNHANTAFPLNGAHQQVQCTACHVNFVFKGTSASCFTCHQKDDAHKGGLGTDCRLCHNTSAWKPSTFNHANTAFPLSGAHQQAQCGACHANHVFKGTPTNCFACHQRNDAHNGSLGTDCRLCHNTNAWKPSTFNHNQSAFPLTGAHSGVVCASCHTNQVFKGTPKNCFACHAKDDHHGGQFGQDCAACHTTSSWSQVTFDHSKSGFPLTGAHASQPCTRCHSGGFAGTPTLCSACHAEPSFHAGLLGSNCGACHNTSGWRPAQFSGPHAFPTKHGGANSCRSCHPSTLSTYTCYSCHNQNEMVKKHQEKNITDLSSCTRCHANGKGGD